MAAVYPKQYKSFTVHKNLVEDIDASHVNNLQDEVRAVQQTLGLNPHQDTSLTMKVNTWASVADRLDSVQRGDGMPVVYLSKTSDSYKAAAGVPMKTISWPSPGNFYDPEGLFNGHSITTNRSGWWVVFARCVWTNATGANATGSDRMLSINVGGSDVMTQDLPPISDGNSHMHIGWQGWVTTGKNIDLRIYHPLLNKTLSVSDLHLSAAMLREQPRGNRIIGL
jgi:hypothetical protein